ncbi:MAG: protein translocase subunit SecD [Hyphomicrobiaceae bacterium]
MLHFPRWKIIAILVTCLAGILFALPNMFAREQVEKWPGFMPKAQIPLGLDLQGGAHLLLGMDAEELKKDWLKGLRDQVRNVLKEVKPNPIFPEASQVVGSNVNVRLQKPEEVDPALKELRARMIEDTGNPLLGTSAPSIEISKGDGNIIIITPTPAGIKKRLTDTANAAIETVNRRVNELGTAESTVARQGEARILVQYPGLKDTGELKELIGRTALLSFHHVHAQMTPEEAQQGGIPSGYRIYPAEGRTDGNYLLEERPIVPGSELSSAQAELNQTTGEWVLAFRFKQTGARDFSRYTQANVGRPFAIVLDDVVISAPNIREAITGGSGQISGSFTAKTANELAVQLRSGALPAKLTIVEERTVGPSLGADSIAAGKLAAMVGSLATIAMVIFAYGTFGVFACIALIMNGILVAALMSAIGITLTLPGIAGFVLTIGMAVDANVLIYERIREELRAGKTAISAIESGFDRAMVTIIDSQLTTLVAALLMFGLGSGPVRGFAVTLAIGIFTSVFTAVTVTRLLVSWWLSQQKGRASRIAVPI